MMSSEDLLQRLNGVDGFNRFNRKKKKHEKRWEFAPG